MARDWSETATMEALECRLEKMAPGNTAPIPITCTKERTKSGDYKWVVDVHIRIPRVTEYEASGEDTTLAGALRRAYLALNSESRLIRTAAKANATFGVEP